jgi:iron complex transport system substrate-binding protein
VVTTAARVLAACLVLVASGSPSFAGQNAPDGQQTTRAPQRVASLNLAADEVLIDLLPPERIVAVTRFVDEAGTSNVLGRVPKNIPRFPKADVERLIALRPDLVVVSEFTDADFLKALERTGLRAHRMRGLDSLDGFRQAILDLGLAVGARGAAERVVARFDERRKALEDTLRGAERPRVLYWASGYTSGARTPFDGLIACGGGRNAAAEASIEGIARIGAERVFQLRPDWLLIGSGSTTAREIRGEPLLSKLDAVIANRIVEVPSESLVALNHHAMGACELIAARIHPGRFRKSGALVQ